MGRFVYGCRLFFYLFFFNNNIIIGGYLFQMLFFCWHLCAIIRSVEKSMYTTEYTRIIDSSGLSIDCRHVILLPRYAQ